MRRFLVGHHFPTRPSPFSRNIILAILIGGVSGLAAVGFRRLIDLFQTLFFDYIGDALSGLGSYNVLMIPALGGVIFGPLIYLLAREAKGHGVPEVMLAVAKNRGQIRGRVSVVKAVASSICIGSGGSVGREGPIVQICASAASYLGQLFGLGENSLRILIAAGAAGGISATFNAPIAGVFFALEIIMRTFSVRNFGIVVISSVTANATAERFFGSVPAFSVPRYSLESPWEIGLYALLGVFAAGLALGFTRLLYLMEDLFDALRGVPEYVKPVLGGLLIGLIGVFFPEVFGVGYGAIEQIPVGAYSLSLLGGLALLKIAATSLTLGSGGSGGIFAPSLFIGAMGGAAFGNVASTIFPDITGPSGGYALVGMAAVVASATTAPITGILIIFEMTRDYELILPLMLAVVVSTFLATRITSQNIYTLKLARRGISLRPPRRISAVSTMPVSSIMNTSYRVLAADASVQEILKEFADSGIHGLPVLNRGGELVGMVTGTDVDESLVNGYQDRTAIDIATRTLVTAYHDESLDSALKKMSAHQVGYLPIVDRKELGRLLGMVSRHDIIRAYAEASLGEEGEEDEEGSSSIY